MARIIEKTVYTFDELTDAAKEKAREWYRSLGLDEWWDGVYEDAERAHLKITGFDLDRADISGEFLEDACATAYAIKEDHGKDCGTYKTAVAFLSERDALPRDEDGEIEDEDALGDLENEFLHNILEEYRIMLRKELEYRESDEFVDEAIRGNEYEFYENGERA